MSENARFTRVVATADGRSVFEEDTLPLEEQPVAAPSRKKTPCRASGYVERDAVGAGAPLHREPQRRASSPAAQTLKNVLAMLPRLSLTLFVVSASTMFE
jgi:hypothetical protein